MTPSDLLSLYKRVLTSDDGTDVCWWYFGTTLLEMDGRTPIPLSYPETAMIYTTTGNSEQELQIEWREVGYFRDTVTGEIAQTWSNPVTGEVVEAPQSFEEGPATYTVRASKTGLDVALEQAHAIVKDINVKVEHTENTIAIIQTERKIRSFPNKDGIIEDPEAGGGAEARTVLSFTARRSDVDAGEPAWVPAFGVYEFRLNALPAWTGLDPNSGSTVVTGSIFKARPSDPVNALARERLSALYPTFF